MQRLSVMFLVAALVSNGVSCGMSPKQGKVLSKKQILPTNACSNHLRVVESAAKAKKTINAMSDKTMSKKKTTGRNNTVKQCYDKICAAVTATRNCQKCQGLNK